MHQFLVYFRDAGQNFLMIYFVKLLFLFMKGYNSVFWFIKEFTTSNVGIEMVVNDVSLIYFDSF